MKKKVFTVYDLYNLVNAQNTAMNFEKETGIESGWYEFASEEEYSVQLFQLGDDEEIFEKKLIEAASGTDYEFRKLLDLNQKVFYNSNDYMKERKMIQDSIIRKILFYLGEYCVD